MSFNLNPRWSVSNAVTNVVTRYAHTRVGQIIPNSVARYKKRAMGCWAGTSKPVVSMLVRVVKYRSRGLDGNPGYAPRAWFWTTRVSTPPMVLAWHGAIGNQDAFWCQV